MTTERIADHVKFAYWVPNVSGGLVTSTIEQRTDRNYEYNAKLAQTAENNGFEYVLPLVREIGAADSDSIGAPLLASA
jgi:dimethylsulfone monooxygenase